jgi:hypothetical protein
MFFQSLFPWAIGLRRSRPTLCLQRDPLPLPLGERIEVRVFGSSRQRTCRAVSSRHSSESDGGFPNVKELRRLYHYRNSMSSPNRIRQGRPECRRQLVVAAVGACPEPGQRDHRHFCEIRSTVKLGLPLSTANLLWSCRASPRKRILPPLVAHSASR